MQRRKNRSTRLHSAQVPGPGAGEAGRGRAVSGPGLSFCADTLLLCLLSAVGKGELSGGSRTHATGVPVQSPHLRPCMVTDLSFAAF